MKDAFAGYTSDVITTCEIKVDFMRGSIEQVLRQRDDQSLSVGIRNFKYLFLRTFPKIGRILDLRLMNELRRELLQGSREERDR